MKGFYFSVSRLSDKLPLSFDLITMGASLFLGFGSLVLMILEMGTISFLPLSQDSEDSFRLCIIFFSRPGRTMEIPFSRA
jgi:hypothetical protein